MMPRFDSCRVVGDRFHNIPLTGRPVTVLRDPDVLMFITCDTRPKSDHFTTFFTTDDDSHYESFFNDFGPYNLAVLYRYCTKLHKRVKAAVQLNKTLVQVTCTNAQKRVNSAFLVGAYAMIYHNVSFEQVWARLRECQPPKFIPFRDAAMGPSTYDLTLYHVFSAVQKALQRYWLDFSTFNVDEYEYYERVENGDFNWIIPGKFLAFCGPHNKSIVENGYPYHAPDIYFQYFRQHNVTTIIRLNKKIYDARKFTTAGFKHLDMFFVDGSTPSEAIVLKFIEAVDSAQGAIAVHCKAGLGRTGTLIGCWIMKEYGWRASDCIAWCRLCRPGSIIGPQQEFLIDKEEWCWKLGGHVQDAHDKKPGMNGLASKVDHIRLGAEKCASKKKSAAAIRSKNDEMCIDDEGNSQGDRLLQVKAKAQHYLARPGTATFTSPTTPIKPILSQNRAKPTISKLVDSNPAATRKLDFAGGLPHKVARVSVDVPSNSSTLPSAKTKVKAPRKASSLSPPSNQPRMKRSSIGDGGPPLTTTRKLPHTYKSLSSLAPAYGLRPRKSQAQLANGTGMLRKMHAQRTNHTKPQ